MTYSELMKWAEERHQYYCDEGTKFMQSMGFPCEINPTIGFYAKKSTVAGLAWSNKNLCEYSLVYLFSVQHAYEQTIAHEVAHIVLDKLVILQGHSYHCHGDLFKFILSAAFKKKPNKYHTYQVKPNMLEIAKGILKILAVKEEIREQELKLSIEVANKDN